MERLCVIFVIVSLFTASRSQTTQCRADINCLPPNCRCWNDAEIPGNLPQAVTPQIVLLTFEYAVNDANADFYRALFEGAVNPNGCPARGTFYPQFTSTDLSIVKSLYDEGHEIGVTSVAGTTPNSASEWLAQLRQVKNAFVGMGIPASRVVGVRAPEMRAGGDDQFIAMGTEGLLYDASCTTSQFAEQESMLWPYTYDYAPGPACDFGAGPELAFPSKWQILLADLEFKGTRCGTPSACTNVLTQTDAFNLFQNNFIQHYEGTRSPFIVAVNPDWVMIDFKRAGTHQFVEYIRAAFPDVWVLTVSQAIEWIKNPVNNNVATTTYAPWACRPPPKH